MFIKLNNEKFKLKRILESHNKILKGGTASDKYIKKSNLM